MTSSKRGPSPGLIVAVCALVLAMTGAAVALPGRGTVNGGDIKRNAVVSKHVKGQSLKGNDLRDETIVSRQVANDGLAPSDVKSLAVADDSLVRVNAFSAAGEAAARANAPEIELYREGDLTIYAKCFRDEAEGDVIGEIYARARDDGALLAGDDDRPGNPGSSLLGPGTAEGDRQLDVEQVEDAGQAAFDTNQGAAASSDGTFFSVLSAIGVKQGTLPGGDGAFGDGSVCLFGATITS
jgi:hypothetical protein